MPITETYLAQVRLLMRLIPIVAEEDCFALKGGTAINLFVRDLPRLSVDIDLIYLPIHSRPEAIAGINTAMKLIEARIFANVPGSRVAQTVKKGAITRLVVSADGTQVKIEISPVLRGVVNEPTLMAVTETVEDIFGFAETTVVSFEDLYAGKLVAALDRQHPRDLFDIRDLLAIEGLSDGLREAFIVYLLSHNRPMFEVLSGRCKDLTEEYRDGFEGMTEKAVTVDELVAAQASMIEQLISRMPDRHRKFLINFEKGMPDWGRLNVPHAKDLPAILWRQKNLDKLDHARRAELVASLEAILSLGAC